MDNPRLLAYYAVNDMIAEGLRKHNEQSWQSEPATMHLVKAARHANSAFLMFQHPEFCPHDHEDHIKHTKQAICRLAMALAIMEAKK